VGTYRAENFLEADVQKKFDVVVGNPPYQGVTKSSEKNNWQPIWPKFLTKSFNDLVKDSGFVCMVTPRTWASGSRNPVKQFFQKYHVHYLNMNVTHYFNIVGDVSSYVIQKSPNQGSVTIIDVNGEYLPVNLSRLHFVPFNITRLGLSIFQKLSKHNHPYKFTESKQRISEFQSGSRIIFLAGRNGAYTGRLFVENEKSDRHGIGQLAIIPDVSKSQAENLEHNLKSKLFVFLFDLLGGNRGLNRTWILNLLPELPSQVQMSDQEIYEHFGLTEEEIAYVEANVK
jgi:hypothetical protein